MIMDCEKMYNNMNIDFCETCGDDTEYRIEEKVVKEKIRGKYIEYTKKEAYCKHCNSLMYVHELNDENLNSLYSKLRREENLISIEEIQNIIDKYKIGKRPLSILLGWGEMTITRYLDGYLPSKEYSDKLKLILKSLDEMDTILEKNKSKISDVAYRKCKEAIQNLKNNEISVDGEDDKILTIARYIVSKRSDITPLALEKLLYYSQAFYRLFTGNELFYNDCEAWVLGPVYKEVYDYYKEYKNSILVSHEEVYLENIMEKNIVDAVIKYFGCYSANSLVTMTHLEKPWLLTREELDTKQPSNRIIEKELIDSYFNEIKNKFNIVNIVDIKDYSNSLFAEVIN